MRLAGHVAVGARLRLSMAIQSLARGEARVRSSGELAQECWGASVGCCWEAWFTDSSGELVLEPWGASVGCCGAGKSGVSGPAQKSTNALCFRFSFLSLLKTSKSPQ